MLVVMVVAMFGEGYRARRQCKNCGEGNRAKLHVSSYGAGNGHSLIEKQHMTAVRVPSPYSGCEVAASRLASPFGE